ncbi:low affinity iron permease family protein [Variovorax atrisoli]|uniref:low affinity iron permease family protein n=1 Tax=Variovorax atrisoli TaxID=3394203 RepID=UPI0010510B84|nr:MULTISPECIES: low affinity iron permease family protein [Variovorax]MBB3639562.1 low affinity Fe/Cu permease [Variovorax sp. BK613]MDR6522075.1 low affinity Fe/Cu permease [Variovorax paradoxus]
MDQLFARFANRIAHIAGSPITFLACVAIVVAWAISGPFFGFSETWQLLINTGTTIVTFLMVFLIQNTQNRDGAALQTKLDELIRSSDAQDEFMGIEKLTDQELSVLHQKCEAAARKSHATLERTRAERRRRGHGKEDSEAK